MDYTLLNKKEKYNYLLDLLNKIKTSSLFQNEKISENKDLISQREDDIKNLNKIINDELKHDGIKRIMIGGKMLVYDSTMESFE